MRRIVSKPRGLKVRCYTACLIGIKEYLGLLSEAKLSDKIGVAELNKSLLNSMPNSCIK